jgi:hypothetical protein
MAAVATSQDTDWTILPWIVPNYNELLSSQGKQYLLVRDSEVFQMEAHHPPKLIATIPEDKLSGPVYLVECGSEVLVVEHDDTMTMAHMVVHRLSDLAAGRYVPLKSIGDKAIFVGARNMCVSSKALPTVAGDTIVYRHPRRLQHVQYCLGSRTWSVAIDEWSLSGLAQGPCSLIHHVFTCCFIDHWYVYSAYLLNLS